jgi:hypothetical protein
LSALRSEDNNFDDYFFLNKDGKIIQKKYEKNYRIVDVLANKQIIMSKR